MKQIKAHVRMEGGRFLTAANASKIIARSTRGTDRSGNRLPSPIEKYKNDPPYFQKWVIRKDRQGYHFQEVNHGGGICGYRKTVRELVLCLFCSLSSDIVVEFDPAA